MVSEQWEKAMADVTPIRKPIALEWKHIKSEYGGENFALHGDGFYISYNPNNTKSSLGALFDSFLSKAENYGKPETALVHEQDDNKFYILYGDWRKAYEQVAHLGFAACYGIFAANLGLIADASDRPLKQTP